MPASAAPTWGVHNRQPRRPSRALARKQAKKSEEAVRDWVTLRKCDKGKQSDCGFPLVALGCRLFPCLEGVEGGLEGWTEEGQLTIDVMIGLSLIDSSLSSRKMVASQWCVNEEGKQLSVPCIKSDGCKQKRVVRFVKVRTGMGEAARALSGMCVFLAIEHTASPR
jgi:hypothetical protein